MSPYEMISLANEFENSVNYGVMAQITVLSGFLVASFAAADRLNWAVTFILLGLFSAFTYFQSIAALTKLLDLRDIIVAIQLEIENGKTGFPQLRMYDVIATPAYDSAYNILWWLLLLSYISAIIFFFIMRASRK
jgi:hypothetical protein